MAGIVTTTGEGPDPTRILTSAGRMGIQAAGRMDTADRTDPVCWRAEICSGAMFARHHGVAHMSNKLRLS
jgi:hypothetical protein